MPPPLGTASASGPRVGAGVQALRGLPPAQPGLLPSLSDPVVISACWASAEACGVQVTAWACVPGEGAQDPAVLPEGLLWGPPGLGQRLETPAPSTCPAFRGFGAASAWVVESWAGALWPRGEPGRGGQPRLWPSALPAPSWAPPAASPGPLSWETARKGRGGPPSRFACWCPGRSPLQRLFAQGLAGAPRGHAPSAAQGCLPRCAGRNATCGVSSAGLSTPLHRAECDVWCLCWNLRWRGLSFPLDSLCYNCAVV